jgi:Tfp pilus assembly protein PilV
MEGFSLLEAVFGILILGMILQGAYLLSHNSVQANATGQDMTKASAQLKDFIEEMRGLDMDSIPRNREIADSTDEYKLKWIVYDENSAGAYQQPAGLLLVCAQLSYAAAGRDHVLETTTLLGHK